MSDEYYRDDEELADFIEDDEPEIEASLNQAPAMTEDQSSSQAPDRISELDRSGHPSASQSSRLLKAHISVLVSALGGPDHTSSDNNYKLGHDALACLKDIKRWLRAVDERNGSYDVAMACAECGLVQNDLIVILCQWDRPPRGTTRSRHIDKVMLACLELLVLLTWPVDVNRNTLFKDFTTKSNNRRAQLGYKHLILTYRGGQTLKAVIRLGIGALKKSKEDREARDLSILRLILFFVRNLLYIEPLPLVKGQKAVANASNIPNGISPEDISLQALIAVFEKSNVFLFLNSIASSVLKNIMEESFGLLTIECLCLLTRGVAPQEILLIHQQNSSSSLVTVPPASSAAGLELLDLLGEESRRKKNQKNAMSTRHGRFGTLLSIQNSQNASYFAVSGQKALGSTYDTLAKLDSSKQWRKTSAFKYDSNSYVRRQNVYLGSPSSRFFATFINQMLESGSFNNLLDFVGRHLTNLATGSNLGKNGLLDAIDPHELSSYFLTIAWFFRFKRERNAFYSHAQQRPHTSEDSLDYGSIGSALSEINFILLISYFRSSFEAKDHDSLHVAMICMKEMLLISNSVFCRKKTQRELALETEADVNEDRELAEGIIRKLFSQQQFLNLCSNLPKTASKHSPEYLATAVSVVHILLKCLESLANEDVHLFLKTRRKMKKLGKRNGLNGEMDRQHWHLIDKGSDEEEDEEEIRFITHERKLDYKKTELSFFHPDTISTHIDYLERFEDLSHEEIKVGISFFHRLFVTHKDYSALFRLDFMFLLNSLQAYLPKSSSISRHVDEFVIYFMKKLKLALERFPTAIEMLFPRFENRELKAFLSSGDLKTPSGPDSGKSSTSKLPRNSYFDEDELQPKAAPTLRFIDEAKSLDEKIGILVYHILKKKNATNFLKTLAKELERIANLLAASVSVISLRLNLGNRRLLISDPHIRLLLWSIGFELPFLQNDETVLKSDCTIETVVQAGESLNSWISKHSQGVGDIEPFLDQVQRVIVSETDILFGEKALETIQSNKAVDLELARKLGISDSMVNILVGLARRRAYDQAVETALDQDYEKDVYSGDEIANDQPRKRTKRNASPSEDSNNLFDDSLSDSQREKLTKPAKSLEFVSLSDDESDSERDNAFLERERQLRNLISQMGSTTDKEKLEIFRDAWAKIKNSTTDGFVASAVEKASGLFVAELDDEHDPATIFSHEVTPELSLSDSQNSVPEPEQEQIKSLLEVTRKRRLIVEDDDDDE